jgi:hypothetical protein
LYFLQNPLIVKFGLLWGRILIIGKGGVLALDKIYSWNISLFAQTSVFDLEIGKRICFAKINQVMAKVIQICQIPSEKFGLQFARFEYELHFKLLLNV